MINDQYIDPQYIVQLKAALIALPLEVLVDTLKKLDETTISALNHGLNKHGDAFIHQLIIDNISPVCEPLLIEALTALEVESFNVYDLRTRNHLNALDIILDNLLVGLDRMSVGNQLIAHVASKVSDINTIHNNVVFHDPGKTNVLMDAIANGDIDAVNILIANGADVTIVSDSGMSCDQIAEFYKDIHPEFFLEYKALTLINAHAAANSPKAPKRL